MELIWRQEFVNVNLPTYLIQQTVNKKSQLVESCPLGYPRLAAFNASEQNFMLYRGFSYVHACLLLDLQTSISALECELDEFDNEDNTDEQRLRLQCREEDIETAREAVSETGTKRRTRRDVLEELHNQTSFSLRPENYYLSDNKYVLLGFARRTGLFEPVGSSTLPLQRPTDRDYRSARTWFHNVRPIVQLEEGYIGLREDILSLRHGREWAGFDGMIESLLHKLDCKLIRKIFCTPDLLNKTSDERVYYFSPSRVEKLVGFIITSVIFVLLVLPVVAMYRLTSLGNTRSMFSAIGVLTIFTLLFSAAMSLLTKAKRHELFAASAAYCAVLVVFITNFSPASRMD
ncbi:hypothetical protein AOQ84DRAFT_387569 [Glonium stellatum]|uniref:DUF6594 domain-containing protein n=1 Tax=Glonium stellatum TaxID=574774 RepID=A0A8E2F4D3_9PEZI|nr:hypothetical protein AOQ84DRAFT_387569 [Glonium stellatum]